MNNSINENSQGFEPNCWHADSDSLAQIAIDTVEREPTEPSGCGAKVLISGLFQQYAQKAVVAERERIIQLILGGYFMHDQAPTAIFAKEVVAAIRRSVQ